MDDALLAAVGAALGVGVPSLSGVAGGDVAAAWRADLHRAGRS